MIVKVFDEEKLKIETINSDSYNVKYNGGDYEFTEMRIDLVKKKTPMVMCNEKNKVAYCDSNKHILYDIDTAVECGIFSEEQKSSLVSQIHDGQEVHYEV